MLTRQSDTASANQDYFLLPGRGSSISTTIFVLFGIYFGLHVLTRSLVSHNLQLDEAEQFVLTQDWRWGYGSQPPLYNWVQHAVFGLLGVNVFALSLLKNLTLWAAYIFTFLAARGILANARLAALATVGMLFVPQIAWESQRDQSHLVLATMLAAATLWIYVRLVKTQRAGWYFLFGSAVALGLLAKYNYLILPAGLICASLAMPQFRRAVLNWKIALALVALAAITAPHVIWMIENRSAVSSQMYKLLAPGKIAGKTPLAGVPELLKAFFVVAITPTVIFAPFLIRRFKTKPATHDPLFALLKNAFIGGIAAALTLVIVSKVTYLRDRWAQPLMFAFPILLVGLVREQLEERHFKRLFGLAAFVAVFVLIAINVTVVGANILKRSHNLNIPYPALATELRKVGFEEGTIVANGFALGGNLKNQFRNCHVMVPELQERKGPQRPALVIWSARTDDLPADFFQYVADLTGVKRELPARYVDIPCQNGKRTSEKFGFFVLP